MPKSLLDRCRPDSIREFRAATHQRFLDGHAAASAGRRLAAIYLWGYAAEMTLKAAYFSLIGFEVSRAITTHDLHAAASRGSSLGIAWPRQGKLHNIGAWGELLVRQRSMIPGLAYDPPTFGNEVLVRSRSLQRLWRETLRYRKNLAYLYEVRQVHDIASWLLTQAPRL